MTGGEGRQVGIIRLDLETCQVRGDELFGIRQGLHESLELPLQGHDFLVELLHEPLVLLVGGARVFHDFNSPLPALKLVGGQSRAVWSIQPDELQLPQDVGGGQVEIFDLGDRGRRWFRGLPR